MTFEEWFVITIALSLFGLICWASASPTSSCEFDVLG